LIKNLKSKIARKKSKKSQPKNYLPTTVIDANHQSIKCNIGKYKNIKNKIFCFDYHQSVAVDTHADDITVVNGHTGRDMQFAIRLERQQLVVKQIDITRVNVTHSYMAHTAVRLRDM
jgi:hypothetical protein